MSEEQQQQQQEQRLGLKLSIGLELGDGVASLPVALSDARRVCADFVVQQLVHPRLWLRGDAAGREQPLTRSDTLLSGTQWSSVVVGRCSRWISLKKIEERHRNLKRTTTATELAPSAELLAERALREEVAWAIHLGLPAVVVELPNSVSGVVRLAQVINQMLLQAYRLQVWVECPLALSVASNLEAAQGAESKEGYFKLKSLFPRESGEGEDEDKPWKLWNMFRTLCGHHPCIFVLLRVTETLPRWSICERWIGEPIKAGMLPCSIFKPNKNNYPVLPSRHQILFANLVKQQVQFILGGAPVIGQGIHLYVQYLAFLTSKMPGLTEQETFESPYYDYLQSPLQPLMDNLESQTYETFERDPVKYREYEEAVYLALGELFSGKSDQEPAIVMVVGAGRGPLVRCVLNASERAKIPVVVYAVEKNPNAIITLRSLKLSLQWTNVTIVHQDMRVWKAPKLADIIVSELLGSFGDNELSPECLDGAQRFLKPKTGISIPCSYTSYLSPMTSHKLWNLARLLDQGSGSGGGGALGAGLGAPDRVTKNLETAYVVKLHNFALLSDPQACFTFEHPNPELEDEESTNKIIINNRMKHFTFVAKENGLIHGFAGYFEAKLFGNVMISIAPETFSHGMFSWFPIYFPLITPIPVNLGDKIEVDFWRQATTTQVWYEWCTSTPSATSIIQNPNGRSYAISR